MLFERKREKKMSIFLEKQFFLIFSLKHNVNLLFILHIDYSNGIQLRIKVYIQLKFIRKKIYINMGKVAAIE